MIVLKVINGLHAGGKERRMVELLKGFKSYDEIQCHLVILSKEIHYREVYDQNVEIHLLERKWKKDPSIIPQLYRITKQVKPDVIHAWDSMSAIYCIPVARLLHIPLINAMITDAPVKLKFGTKIRSFLAFPFSQVVLSNSAAGLKSYHAPSHKGHYIHNGFDFKRLQITDSPATIKQQWAIKAKKVVGMVGAFQPRKDYDTFISSAISIIREGIDVHFLAVGGGIDLEKTKRLVPADCQAQITFTGNQKNIESIVNIFDIGVLMTNNLVHGEGISNSIMEYMALEKPVIASEGGGTAELVEDGKTGFIISPGSEIDLANKIKYLLENPEKAKMMGQVGYSRVKEEFNLPLMTKRYVTLYQNIVNKYSNDLSDTIKVA